jgi:hypothetical protein
MLGIPRPQCKEGKCENERNNDDCERSAVDRACPVLTIPHAALLLDHHRNAAGRVMVPGAFIRNPFVV